jgi:hypothetical protein
MKPSYIAASVLIMLAGIGVANWLGASERRPWPKPGPPPPPSPIYQDSKERVPTAEEIARISYEHNATLELEIQRALISRNALQREAAFTFLLPELIQVDPERVAAMFARQQRGEPRNTLRTEVARQWAAQDPGGAIDWMKSLSDNDRRASAVAAIEAVAPYDPSLANAMAEKFGVGRADGSLDERLLGQEKEVGAADVGRAGANQSQ